MRTIIVVLLMAVFFLLGIVYQSGAQESGHISSKWKEDDRKSAITEIEDTEELVKVDPERLTLDPVDVDQPSHFTQKMAASLEGIVSGFYDAVVELLYTFTEAFF